MKKIFILAIATVVFASCNKYNNSSNEVISKDYPNVDPQYNSATFYTGSCKVYEDSEVAYYDIEDEDYVYSSEYNSYTMKTCGETDFTITDMNGHYYHVSIDDCGNVTAYDLNGNFYRASSDGYGNTTGFDSNGNFYHSHTDDSGNTNAYDSDGNYYYSHTDGCGNTTGFDSDGNFYHTYTDDFGNTTGYDSNGNFYCAHTDDLGNTTISIF